MSHNSFGKLFKVTTWGESHGTAIGCVIDGCPPGVEIDASEIQLELLISFVRLFRHIKGPVCLIGQVVLLRLALVVWHLFIFLPDIFLLFQFLILIFSF